MRPPPERTNKFRSCQPNAVVPLRAEKSEYRKASVKQGVHDLQNPVYAARTRRRSRLRDALE